jgi:hypothetical protein
MKCVLTMLALRHNRAEEMLVVAGRAAAEDV